MKAFYQRHPLASALVLIALYVGFGSVLLSLPAPASFGPICSLAFHLALALALLGLLYLVYLLCSRTKTARKGEKT